MKMLVAGLATLGLLMGCGGGDSDKKDATSGQSAGTETPVESTPEPGPLLLPLPRNTSSAVTASDLATRIETLASDTYEGRGPGAQAGEASADWIAAEMERIGLEPGGPGGSWFQTVEMVEQTLVEENSYLRFTGSNEDLELKKDAVIWTKVQSSPSLELSNSPIVFVGYGATAPEYEWTDYGDLDYAGKTVIILVNDPGYATEDPSLFNGRAMTYYGRWTYKYEEAARQGASAAIIIHETDPASYGWEVVANSWSGTQADLVRENGGEDRVMVEGWITEDVARKLFSDAGLDFDQLKAAAKTPAFSPVNLEEITANARVEQTISKGTSRNVIGRLPGTGAPDEHVLIVAHWDHLGKKDTFLEDDIFNGAVDNATGTAAMLEIAEAMAAEPRERSVLFLAVTLEESGLLGSAYYASSPTVPLHQIVAGINIDALIPMGLTRDMIVYGYGNSELEDLLKPVVEAQGRYVRPDPSPQAGYFYRSDHISFAKEGVPMLYVDNGIDRIQGGEPSGRAMDTAHYQFDYHKVSDEYAADWDLSGMVQDVEVLTTLMLLLANSDAWPNWYEGNEFRALRDAQLADQKQ